MLKIHGAAHRWRSLQQLICGVGTHTLQSDGRGSPATWRMFEDYKIAISGHRSFDRERDNGKRNALWRNTTAAGRKWYLIAESATRAGRSKSPHRNWITKEISTTIFCAVFTISKFGREKLKCGFHRFIFFIFCCVCLYCMLQRAIKRSLHIVGLCTLLKLYSNFVALQDALMINGKLPQMWRQCVKNTNTRTTPHRKEGWQGRLRRRAVRRQPRSVGKQCLQVCFPGK